MERVGQKEGWRGWPRINRSLPYSLPPLGRLSSPLLPSQPPPPSPSSSTTTADLHPLQLASSFRALHHLCLRYPSVALILLPPAPSRDLHEALDRRRALASSTCTRRYAGPDPPTRFSLSLSLLFPRVSPFFTHVHLCNVSLPFFPYTMRFHLLSLSISLDAFPTATSRRRRAKLAQQSRSVAWMIISICANGRNERAHIRAYIRMCALICLYTQPTRHSHPPTYIHAPIWLVYAHTQLWWLHCEDFPRTNIWDKICDFLLFFFFFTKNAWNV